MSSTPPPEGGPGAPGAQGLGARWLVPIGLLAGLALGTFGLAQIQPFEKDVSPDTPVETGDPAAGRTVFAGVCASCHGANAEGGIGPKLAGNPIALAQARAVIVGGRGTMPASLASGERLKDLLGYLETVFAGGSPAPAPPVPPPPPPADESAATGDAAAGRTVFAEACASCHGANAQGGIGPALDGNPITLAAARAVIQNGRGAMPAGLVSGVRRDDLLAYLSTILGGTALPPAPPPAAAGGTAAFSGPDLAGVRVELDAPAPREWGVWLLTPAGTVRVGTVPAGAQGADVQAIDPPPLDQGADGVSVGADAGAPAAEGRLADAAAAGLERLYVRDAGAPEGILAAAVPVMESFKAAADRMVDAQAGGDVEGMRAAAADVVAEIRAGGGAGLITVHGDGLVDRERAVLREVRATPDLPSGAAAAARRAAGAARATADFLGIVVRAARRVRGAPSAAAAASDADLVEGLSGRIVAGQERVAEYAPGMAEMPLD